MSELTERIQLTREHRDLILKYGYVSGRLERSLRRWPKNQIVRRVWMTRVELHWLIGDLSHCCVKGKAGREVEAVNDLCNHLEYAQQTGDGDLDALWSLMPPGVPPRLINAWEDRTLTQALIVVEGICCEASPGLPTPPNGDAH